MKKQMLYTLIWIFMIFVVCSFKCVYAFEQEDVISDVFLVSNESLDIIQKKILDASSGYYEYDSSRITVNMKVTKSQDSTSGNTVYYLGER